MTNLPVVSQASQLAVIDLDTLPTPLLFDESPESRKAFWEYFLVDIENDGTRKTYLGAIRQFSDWCSLNGIDLISIEPIMISMYIKTLKPRLNIPSRKLHLTAIRQLFKWLVVKQIIPSNPATDVTSPRYSQGGVGRTPVLEPEDMVALFESIELKNTAAYRDRAMIAVMAYSFARIGAVIKLKLNDYEHDGKRSYFNLLEKGSRINRVPAHHTAQQFVDEYIAYAGIENDKHLPLFRALERSSQMTLSERPVSDKRAWAMVKRRCAKAGLSSRITNHSFRGTGITTFMLNGGSLENAAKIAGHVSTSTTQLYDRTRDNISLDEIERILY